MRNLALFTGLAIAALNLLILVPAIQPYGVYLLAAAIALSLWLAAKALTYVHAPVAPETPAPPVAKEPTGGQAEAEVVALLGLFQEKGRLIDFLMDDIAAYSDSQVGAAGRVVHEGCKSVLREHFDIAPISSAAESAQVTVTAEDAGRDYRLIGRVVGEPPFTGTLIHKGWTASRVKLPSVLPSEGGRLPPIAPAQVELR